MAEYIEREAFRQLLVDRQITTNFFDNTKRNEDGCIIDLLDKFSAADVAPVVCGVWEEVEDFGGDSHWRCSVCGCEWYFEAGGPVENGSNYCPNCGAKMEVKE